LQFLLFIASGFPLDLKVLADTFLVQGSAVHKSVLSTAQLLWFLAQVSPLFLCLQSVILGSNPWGFI
jgi:hypothetical protein